MSVSRAATRITLVINEESCKGCGLCVAVCPRQAMSQAKSINSRGFHPACLLDPENCTGCAQCALMCPDTCLRITREPSGKQAGE